MVTVRAAPGSLAERVARIVESDLPVALPTAIVDAMPVARVAPLDALTDFDLQSGCIAPLADLAETLAELVPEHRRIVLICTTAGLGDWDAALTGAFAAGAVGMMRSVALEYIAQDVAINMIAVPSADVSHAANAAALARALLQSGGANGQVIPCDAGENLRMSRARPRRPALP